MTDRHNRASQFEGAAARLLEREPPEGYRTEWTRHLAAQQKQQGAAELKSCVVFQIAESHLALQTSLVDVVAENSAFHTVPRGRSGIPITLANVRGELLVCISLAALLGIAETSPVAGRKQHSLLISCRRNEQRFAFPVDEIQGVQQYAANELKDLPATLAGAGNNYTRGLITVGDRTVGLIDEAMLFEAWSKSLL